MTRITIWKYTDALVSPPPRRAHSPSLENLFLGSPSCGKLMLMLSRTKVLFVTLGTISCGEFADPTGFQPASCEEAIANDGTLVEGAPSFQDWRERYTVRSPEGLLIFEDDIIVRDEDLLRAFYLERFAADKSPGAAGFRSIVSCQGDGFDNVWSVSQKLDITYCYGSFSSSSLRDSVKGIMPRATMDWERAGDVNFIEVDMTEAQCNCIFEGDALSNDDCDTHTDRARFRIRQGGLGSLHPASADLPGSAIRELIVDTSVDDTGEKLYRLITHELGHALGLKHEHLRFDNSNTLSDCSNGAGDPWRVVTDPDSASIMGYGHCGGIQGINSPDVISPLDRQGTAYLYNLPRNEFTSFTSGAVDEILWFVPSESKYIVWRADFNPQGEIQFPLIKRQEFCASTTNNSCDSSTRNKPIPVALTAVHQTDVINYGPSTLKDSLLKHTTNGAFVELEAIISEQPFDTPIIGRFLGSGAAEDIWWVRPGPEADPIGQFTGNSYSVIPDNDFVEGGIPDSWFRPLVGLWINREDASNNPYSQVLWFREGAGLFVSYQSEDLSTMIQEQVSPACLLSNLLHPIPLRGDFDGDNEIEIFFASVANGQHVFWRDTVAMWADSPGSPCSDPDIAQIVAPHGVSETFTKPFVGDFDGDDSDDIYWYSPNNQVPSEIWLDIGSSDGPTIVAPVLDGNTDPPLGDLTPFVGDFNGDLCDDIFWFSPDQNFQIDPNSPTGGEEEVATPSPLWRSLCDSCSTSAWTGFTENPNSLLEPPLDGYPVGYDPRSAGRHADLDPCAP